MNKKREQVLRQQMDIRKHEMDILTIQVEEQEDRIESLLAINRGNEKWTIQAAVVTWILGLVMGACIDMLFL